MTGTAMARGEFDREARRILPRLAAREARLEPLPGTPEEFGLVTARSRGRRPRTRVSAQIVQALAAEGLIVDSKVGGYVLSGEGEAFLRRIEARTDPFRAQHHLKATQQIKGDDNIRRTHLVNAGESPLGWLRRRKGPDGRPLITEAQYEAGERLRADFTRGQMQPRITANWTLPLSSTRHNAGGAVDVSDSALAARERFYKALDAAGPGLADALVAVCCHLSGLEQAEKVLGWPQRAGKVVLAIALDRLADHYGLNGAPEPARRRIRLWRADERKEEEA